KQCVKIMDADNLLCGPHRPDVAETEQHAFLKVGQDKLRPERTATKPCLLDRNSPKSQIGLCTRRYNEFSRHALAGWAGGEQAIELGTKLARISLHAGLTLSEKPAVDG